MNKPSDYQEVEIKAQSIIWCDNSLEEKEKMMNELLDRVREETIKTTIEAVCKRLDDLGDLCDHIPVWKSAVRNSVTSIGTQKEIKKLLAKDNK